MSQNASACGGDAMLARPSGLAFGARVGRLGVMGGFCALWRDLMTQTIWQSNCLGATEFSGHELFERDKSRTTRQAEDASDKNLQGLAVDRALFPDALYHKNEKADQALMPDYFRTTFPCVSERFAEFLKGFHIGDTRFLPIDIYLSDRKTRRDDRYFIMNIVSQKSCWITEESNPNSYSFITEGFWLFMNGRGDGKVVVDRSAAEGADLWVDPRLRRCLFFSDRLKRALNGSNMRPRFYFYRCKVTG
ncbi:MAG: DUF1629 domain-containing protein [Pseudomonadota bacterium]